MDKSQMLNVVHVLDALVCEDTGMTERQAGALASLRAEFLPTYCCSRMERAVCEANVVRGVSPFSGSILWEMGGVMIEKCPFCGADL